MFGIKLLPPVETDIVSEFGVKLTFGKASVIIKSLNSKLPRFLIFNRYKIFWPGKIFGVVVEFVQVVPLSILCNLITLLPANTFTFIRDLLDVALVEISSPLTVKLLK